MLFAVQAPSNAQQAEDRALRGSIGLPDGPVAPLPPVVVPVDPSIDGVEPVAGEGLGGLGDDSAPGTDLQGTGGLGDQPSDLEAEEIVLPEEEIGLTPPTRAIFETTQIHSALLPEPHDLDPFVPIGIRIGTFF